jgi:hypothetical protein
MNPVRHEVNHEYCRPLTKFVVRSPNTALIAPKYYRSKIAVNTEYSANTYLIECSRGGVAVTTNGEAAPTTESRLPLLRIC